VIDAGMPPPATLLPGEQWRRLHPLSPLVRVGAVIAAVPFLLVGSFSGGRQSQDGGRPNITVLIWSGLAILGLIGGFVSWLVTRWRIDQGDLQIERGLIRRQSFRIPLERIQAIDVIAPLTARILGLAEVRVISAGRGLEHGRLAYLSAAEAPVVRAQLLALAHGLAATTPEPPGYPLARVDNSRLAMGLLTRASVIVPGMLLFGAIVAAMVRPANASFTAVAVTGGLAFQSVVVTARRFNDDYNFSIAEAGDGLRLDRGLLQQRHETIPFTRIQAVRLVEPLLWRLFGWCRLDVDVARQRVSHEADRDANRVARTLIPVASRDLAVWLLSRVMPAVTSEPPAGSSSPRRARLRAPLSYHFLAAWNDDRYVCARTGRLQSATVVVPVDKVQSVRLASGPVQRALRLATVHVDTAGRRWQAAARCRDEGDADALLWTIAERARDARRQRSAAAAAAAHTGH
jgi:putative membrane protein